MAVPMMATDTYHTSKLIRISDYTQNKTLVTLELKAVPDNKCRWGLGT